MNRGAIPRRLRRRGSLTRNICVPRRLMHQHRQTAGFTGNYYLPGFCIQPESNEACLEILFLKNI
jgi:hypothetical protein